MPALCRLLVLLLPSDFLPWDVRAPPVLRPCVALNRARYLLELSLSVDNLFVFVLIFDYFQVPAAYQVSPLLGAAGDGQAHAAAAERPTVPWPLWQMHPDRQSFACSSIGPVSAVRCALQSKVLAWGIAGAVVFRAILIGLGLSAVSVSSTQAPVPFPAAAPGLVRKKSNAFTGSCFPV